MQFRFVALAAAAALAGGASAQTTVGEVPLRAEGTTLDVSAEGRTTRVPDLAVVRAGVVTQSGSAAGAIADNAARVTRMLAALRRAGIAERDIQTASLSLAPQYRYAEGQAPAITGYQATNTLTIRFRDVARSGATLDALVREGANQIDGPTLTLDQPDAALDEARADAVRRARARADLYARAAGLSVARIVSIAEGAENAGGGPVPQAMYAVRARADTPVRAGERDVTVGVTVRFLLR